MRLGGGRQHTGMLKGSVSPGTGARSKVTLFHCAGREPGVWCGGPQQGCLGRCLASCRRGCGPSRYCSSPCSSLASVEGAVEARARRARTGTGGCTRALGCVSSPARRCLDARFGGRGCSRCISSWVGCCVGRGAWGVARHALLIPRYTYTSVCTRVHTYICPWVTGPVPPLPLFAAGKGGP